MINTDPIANMEEIHKNNLVYQMLLQIQRGEYNRLGELAGNYMASVRNNGNIRLNEQDVQILKSVLMEQANMITIPIIKINQVSELIDTLAEKKLKN